MIADLKTGVLDLSDMKKLSGNLRDELFGRGSGKTGAQVIGLYGDLGAGKTTFMQFFGEALGVKERMLSPTFVIEKIYKLEHSSFDHLIHIDAYRLDDPKEMLALGWEEIVKNPRNIICVEWADKIQSLFPEKYIRISLTHVEKEDGEKGDGKGGDKRAISIEE